MRKLLLASAMLAAFIVPATALDGKTMHVVYTINDYTKDYMVPMDSADACKAGVANYLATGFVAQIRANGGTVIAGCE